MTAPTIDVTVGPLACEFGNKNDAMNLRAHRHHAEVHLTYRCATGEHGYPSFKHTNDELRGLLAEATARTFLDATNEDVAARLFAAFDGFVTEAMRGYGGEWALVRLDLDVYGVLDKIGHDEGGTRYTYAVPAYWQGLMP